MDNEEEPVIVKLDFYLVLAIVTLYAVFPIACISLLNALAGPLIPATFQSYILFMLAQTVITFLFLKAEVYDD